VNVELAIQQRLADETRIPQYQLRAAGTRLLWATLSGKTRRHRAAERDLRELSGRVDDFSLARHFGSQSRNTTEVVATVQE